MYVLKLDLGNGVIVGYLFFMVVVMNVCLMLFCFVVCIVFLVVVIGV